ncbi:UNVERIFIED_CONTAM: hypothetical protein FKN15_011337 [Acipenser sinensis]
MAELISKEQFVCSVCLEILKEPVTVPCGHSFCTGCIKKVWDQAEGTAAAAAAATAAAGSYSCPQCRALFFPRPVLGRNTMLAEVVEKLRKSPRGGGEGLKPGPAAAGSGGEEVPCDFCTGTHSKALKSCLVCLASYCETHLQPHLDKAALRRHRLIHPVRDFEGKLCESHQRVLEVFCRTDQTCICALCTSEEHASHTTVFAEKERTEKQWTVPTGCNTGFIVSYNQTNAEPKTVNPDQDSVILTGLAPGTVYEVTVKTESNGKESSPVSSTGITFPAQVSSLQCSAVSGGYSLSLDWGNPVGRWTEIEVDVSNGDIKKVETCGPVQCETRIDGLSPARYYTLAVTTVSGEKRSFKAISIQCQTDTTAMYTILIRAVIPFRLVIGYHTAKEFIAAQGPLPNTVEDFWRMAWENQVEAIVMLTNCIVNSRMKSPERRSVRQFHFTAWPDHDVPDNTATFIQFRTVVRKFLDNRERSGPAISQYIFLNQCILDTIQGKNNSDPDENIYENMI